jgi:glycosyltransferase involved in cell wall biosynthesis
LKIHNKLIKKINIVGADNGKGLSRDIEMLAGLLKNAGYRVFFKGNPRLYRSKFIKAIFKFRRLTYDKLLRRPSYDMNLFLESIYPEFIPQASINCLIPNPEWFRDSNYSFLSQIDWVICKTKSAQEIFEKLGCKTRFTGFTSLDKADPRYTCENGNNFFHLAGGSLQKGTNALINLWLRHPEWPLLTIVQSPAGDGSIQKVEPVKTNNIHHVIGYLDEIELCKYLNNHNIHLCPSEAEGFGHIIVEALSTGAIVLTTDAPPMNELITSERGILVKYYFSEAMNLGVRYFVDPLDLEKKIEQILGMDEISRKRIRKNARLWYEENDKKFRSRFIDVIEDLIGSN